MLLNISISLYCFLMCILVFTYILYPILSKAIFTANKKYEKKESFGSSYIIIAAYNEEDVIENKIFNALKYIGDRTKIVIVSDASTDNTDSICEELSASNDKIIFYVNKNRGGKNTCINLAIEKIKPSNDDILIFTDCNTFFDRDSLNEIYKPLLDGSSLVAGSMVYESINSESAVSEGIYWRYEEWLRSQESNKGRLIVCNGGLFGMWAKYFKVLPPFVPNDFEGPLRLCGKGKHVIINPKAKGFETAINSTDEEYSRKERQANRQMNCVLYLWREIDFSTKFQVLFHKVIRWFGLHLFLLSTIVIVFTSLISNFLAINIMVWLHVSVIILMVLSWFNNIYQLDNKLLPKILHACKVHLYSAKGALESVRGNKTSIWEKAKSNR